MLTSETYHTPLNSMPERPLEHVSWANATGSSSTGSRTTERNAALIFVCGGDLAWLKRGGAKHVFGSNTTSKYHTCFQLVAVCILAFQSKMSHRAGAGATDLSVSCRGSRGIFSRGYFQVTLTLTYSENQGFYATLRAC